MNLTNLLFLEAASGESGSALSTLGMLFPMALLALVFYFFIYRPQKKQEKEVADMRSSIELGDVIVTTGGIIGMVVKVKDDMLLIESSGNRTKLQIQKWAVHSIIEKANEPEVSETKSEAKVSKDEKIKLKEDKKEKKSKKDKE